MRVSFFTTHNPQPETRNPKPSMNTLDFLILAGLAVGLVIGLRSGLIKQALSFVGLLLAFVLSLHLMTPVGEMAAGSLGISEDIAPLVGFVLVFLGVQVAVFALTQVLESIIGALKLSGVNRLLGGAVGAFKAGLVLSVVFLVLGYVQVPSEQTREESAFYAPVSTVLPSAWGYVSDTFPQVAKVSEQFGKRVEEEVESVNVLPQVTPSDSTGDGEE